MLFREVALVLKKLVHLTDLRMNDNPFTLFLCEYQHILVAKCTNLLSVDGVKITEVERDIAMDVVKGLTKKIIFW